MLTLLFIGTLSLTFDIQPVEASGTIYIRADGSVEGTTHISSVDNVTYTFTDNIYDEIVVEKDDIMVDGAGYTVQGTGSGTGIDLSSRSNVTVKNTTVKRFSYGIRLLSSSNNVISSNTASDNNWGITLEYSINNTVSGNNASNNYDWGIVVYYSANNTVWSNTASNNYYGIVFDSCSNSTVTGNNVYSNNYDGISITHHSDFNIISNNNVYSNGGYGMYLVNSSTNTISENNITNGIGLRWASNNSVLGNTFSNDGLFVYDSYGNVVEDNLVNSKPLVYLEGVSDYTVDNAGQVVLVNCDGILVENLILSNTYSGIELWGTSNTKIANCSITANQDGIDLLHSSNVNITNNRITENNGYGILLWYSSNNSVSENNITANNRDGMLIYVSSNYNNIYGNNIVASNESGISLLDSSNNIIVRNNMLTNGNKGIELCDSSDNSIVENNMVANGYAGILLGNSTNNSIVRNNIFANGDEGIGFYRSSDNIVVGNSITNSNRGIWLDESSNNGVSGNSIVANSYEGIWFSDSSNNSISRNHIANNLFGIFLSGSNNFIYHNNFLGNTQEVKIYTSGYANFWDDGYPSGGNFWSNYTGVDSDHDGIGDSEHVIDANNTDNYPLMGMFSDFNATLEYSVQTVCNSSISDFHFNGTAICFNFTGENDTTGFCRICIPRALMNETYKVFVNGTEVSHTLLPCSNGIHSYLYFMYNHSTQEVIVIPEFPTWTSMLLIFIVLTVATVICKRRLLKHQ